MPDNGAYDKFEDERTDADLVKQFGAYPDFVVESTDSVPCRVCGNIPAACEVPGACL